jgi:hypothetical protein
VTRKFKNNAMQFVLRAEKGWGLGEITSYGLLFAFIHQFLTQS